MATTRWIVPDPKGWAVLDSPSGSPVAVHAKQATAIEHARRDVVDGGGGEIQITSRSGNTRRMNISSTMPTPPVVPARASGVISADEAAAVEEEHAPTRAFDKWVPWVLLLVPSVLTLIFGNAAPELLAPAITESDGTVVGVGIATFVLSSAAAVTVYAGERGVGWQGLIAIGAGSLIAANLIAVVIGFQSLEPVWNYVSGPWYVALFLLIAAFFFAGTAVYGWLGAILGVVAGAVAGDRFAKYVAAKSK